MNWLQRFWHSLPRSLATGLAHGACLITGLLAGLILHYLLYRLSLPGTPFIYVVF